MAKSRLQMNHIIADGQVSCINFLLFRLSVHCTVGLSRLHQERITFVKPKPKSF